MIPGIRRRTGWLMASGVINFIAGTRTRDIPIVIVEQPRSDDVVLGYIICDHTTCCREHGTHVTPHTRCILR
jgi:hypothetical protein